MDDELSKLRSLEEVDAAFFGLMERYQALKEACESQVVSWRWASDDLYHPCPLHFERHGWKKGRFLTDVPVDQADKQEYGLGADGQILVARQHIRFQSYPERLYFYETFYLRNDNEIQVACFDYHDPYKSAISFGVGRYDNGRLIHWQGRGKGGVSQEEYIWDGDHVTRINVKHAPVDLHGNHGPLSDWMHYDIQYDPAGRIQEITGNWPCYGDGTCESSKVIYRRRPKDASYGQLLAAMRQGIKQAVIDVVRQAGVSSSVYCLALYWDPGQHSSLPPAVGIGLDSQRTAWIREHGEDAKWYLWNPAEWEHIIPIHSAQVEQLCEPVNQECRLRDTWTQANRVLNEVAKELGQIDWTGTLQTTDDFVVYVVDTELVDFFGNFKASVPPELVQAYRKRGLFGQLY